MTQLTNKMIIQGLNENSSFMKLELIFLGLLILLLVTVSFFKLKKSGKGKKIILMLFMFAFFIGIPVIKSYPQYSSIQYSIKNNCFEVVTDTIVRKKHTSGSGYYVYLTNNGVIHVDNNTYYDCSEGESVYVVITKDKFGKKYLTGELFSTRIYSTSKYQYVDDK